MLEAIDTSTVSDFFNDHPGEAFAIAGAIILLLILVVLVRRRRTREREGGVDQLSRKDAWRAKKEARAEAKQAKDEAKAPNEEGKAGAPVANPDAVAQPEADVEVQEKPEKKAKPSREERQTRKEERKRRKAERKGQPLPESESEAKQASEEAADREGVPVAEEAAAPATSGANGDEEKSTMLAAALGLAEGEREKAEEQKGDAGKPEEPESAPGGFAATSAESKAAEAKPPVEISPTG